MNGLSGVNTGSAAVMVTGGAGFIGSHMVCGLLERGYEVCAIDRVPIELARGLEGVRDNARFHYYEGDMRHDLSLEKFWRADAAAVLHLASVSGVEAVLRDPFEFIDIAVTGTRNVLEHASRDGVKVIYASSVEVYGENPDYPWHEESLRVLGPTDSDRLCYASAKALCEHMLHAVNKKFGTPFTIARFFNVYGPGQRSDTLIAHSIHNVLNGVAPILHNGGTATRCFAYIGDIVDALCLILAHKRSDGEIFNIGNPAEVSVKQVIETVLRLSGTDIGYREAQSAGADNRRRLISADKIRRVLGWEAKTSLEKGIQSTIAWARESSWWLAK